MDDPEAFRLQPTESQQLTLEETTLADVIYTAGSTGRPTPFYDTVHDRLARIAHIRRAAEIAGITKSDTVMNLFPLSAVPHQGFLSAMWGATAIGAKLLSGLTGRSYQFFDVHRRMDDVVGMIERERVTVLWGITAYVRRIVVRADELGADFGSVRLALMMGEPCPAPMRQDVRSRLEALGAYEPVIGNGYGYTEMQAPATECVELGGRHQAAPEQFYFEVIDPETGAHLQDGKPGLLLISHLNRRGTVLLRYEVGDIVAIDHSPCPHCGSTEPRFIGDPYRADGLTKVNGTLVNPASLLDQLAGVLNEGAKEFQLVIRKEKTDDPYSTDILLLRLATDPEMHGPLTRSVSAKVGAGLEVVPEIEFIPSDSFGEIARGYKFRRFVDERLD
jgi:phenylacetate-coenzyme A ligase PaaK-like adenylate-forming protein